MIAVDAVGKSLHRSLGYAGKAAHVATDNTAFKCLANVPSILDFPGQSAFSTRIIMLSKVVRSFSNWYVGISEYLMRFLLSIKMCDF